MKKIKLIIAAAILAVAFVSVKIFLDAAYRMPILMYHSIDYSDAKKNKLIVSPEAFEMQIRYLTENGYRVVALDKAVSYMEKRRRAPAKTVAITFDDGYDDNYKYVYPILKKYNVPATIFVPTDSIGKEGFLTWPQIHEMSDSGLVDIESHTKSHQFLTGCSDAQLKDELEGSKAVLEKKLKKSVKFLCYPMGNFDERVKAAARLAGYKAAFATKPRTLFPTYDLYEIKRVRISPTSDTPFVFSVKLSGYQAFIKSIQTEGDEIPKLLWKKKEQDY